MGCAFALGLAALSLHVAADQDVEVLAAGRQMPADQARLAFAGFGQAVVVVRAEAGLAVADEYELSHGTTIGGPRKCGQRETDVRSVYLRAIAPVSIAPADKTEP